MGSEWPVVGRERELEAMRAVLAGGGHGILLAGPAGVGKTRLGMECLDMARWRGFTTARSIATRTTRGLPLGALAQLVPRLPESASGPADLLGKTAAAIRACGDGRPLAILMDDAHLLDDLPPRYCINSQPAVRCSLSPRSDPAKTLPMP